MRGEGERRKEEKISDFRQAMRWLIGQAEHATARQSAAIGLMNPRSCGNHPDPEGAPLFAAQIDDAIGGGPCVHLVLMGETRAAPRVYRRNASVLPHI
jgi:DNA gyrase subunit B